MEGESGVPFVLKLSAWELRICAQNPGTVMPTIANQELYTTKVANQLHP